MMELQNLTGLEKPFTILFQGLINGCSHVFMPFIKRWQAKYEIETKEIQDAYGLVTSMKKACQEELVSSIRTHRDAREISNIVKVYTTAITEMQAFIAANPTFEAKEIDPDWSSVFYDCAKGCSREEMQILWAKILVKKCQGERYYKRTLWTLKNMETEEAECLVELAPYLINKSFIPAFVYEKGLMAFNKIQTLADCGCINPQECVISYRAEDDVLIAGHSVRRDSKLEKIDITGMSMTDVGYQLADLVQGVIPNERFKEEFRLYLERAYNGTKLIRIG